MPTIHSYKTLIHWMNRYNCFNSHMRWFLVTQEFPVWTLNTKHNKYIIMKNPWIQFTIWNVWILQFARETKQIKCYKERKKTHKIDNECEHLTLTVWMLAYTKCGLDSHRCVIIFISRCVYRFHLHTTL